MPTSKKHTTVKISYWWEEETPDGSSCRVCEDTIYLRQFRLMYAIPKITERTPTEFAQCQSCHEMVQEALAE